MFTACYLPFAQRPRLCLPPPLSCVVPQPLTTAPHPRACFSPRSVTGRRRNKLNVIKLWLHALKNQSLPHDGVEGSGVYMREVLPGKLPYKLQRGVDVP